jgi:hypothetical protein
MRLLSEEEKYIARCSAADNSLRDQFARMRPKAESVANHVFPQRAHLPVNAYQAQQS